MSQLPKLIDAIQPCIEIYKGIELLSEALEMRLEAQQTYEKSLARVSIKLSSFNKQESNRFNNMLNQMSRLHSELSFQIGHFRTQLRGDVNQMKVFLKEINADLDIKTKEAKRIEKEFKTGLDKLDKSRWKAQNSMKELDQKLILNEISKLNIEGNEQLRKKIAANNIQINEQQKEIVSTYNTAVESFGEQTQAYNKMAPQLSTQVQQVALKLKTHFFDVLNKLLVHQVSLLRNFQYDLDNYIQKVEKQDLETFVPPTVQVLAPYVQPKQEDSWQPARKNLMVTEEQKQKIQPSKQFYSEYLKAISSESQQELKTLINRFKTEYEALRPQIQSCLEGARLQGKTKMEQKDFSRLCQVYAAICQTAYLHKDFEILQLILLFAATYYKGEKANKQYIVESIKGFKFYSYPQFWKFYCISALKTAIAQCKRAPNTPDSALHQKNATYATLLTCANNMIQFGHQKHTIKNFIGKAAKSYPLTQLQISQILKFIQNQFQSQQQKKQKQ